MSRQVIYTCGFPKSGTTYLTRLLGDILNSPTGGCMPSEDAKEVATEGQDRPGPYIVRKGHFVLIDDDGPGKVVPRPHRLAWKRLTNEKIVFLVRDPRDICVSGAYHWAGACRDWKQSIEVFLERMIKGNVAKCGRWDEYVSRWYSLDDEITDMDFAKYERLLVSCEFEIIKTLKWLNIEFEKKGILLAIKRQSFSTRKARIGNDEKELRRNNMRKGIVGDWKNHFTPEMNKRIWDEFGWMMERLGYEPENNFFK